MFAICSLTEENRSDNGHENDGTAPAQYFHHDLCSFLTPDQTLTIGRTTG
jgi:hypothetical protein